ncbi:hypothetical protein BMR05_13645 [Methylococcaceae bacterium HT4]|nr:hypothetical protein BMR11_17365 [Methylococcaceae bacterium CS5]TXK94843.1 hypothetical protein BMR10_11965 [Methylococcaceae bacterium CS4]TXL02419.1 hypothetical protein BMR07_17835 [Methylococcaceae bacterium CS1]TXL02904.1 hypothetical protein BMR08_17690 [Methylococcaceae bacterium CS2]TXL03906.1 hypothetical protein BMR09_13855 [Methylococcaceae bacterium CS3]TXL12948.1 hypothetical protein BMR05_13645 [Methylococcaceae bacterium HT4]TXL17446.1 hypothetical protein BMR04_05780 [Meth
MTWGHGAKCGIVATFKIRTKQIMQKRYKICSTVTLLTLLNGCMTFSGDRLSDLNPIIPKRSPSIEESVGDFTMHIDGGKLITNNKAGRIINDSILDNWKKNNYISDFTYVPKEKFTGNAEYNLTLKGHQEGNSSIVMQILSGLTLFVIPNSVDISYDLIYELEEVSTGKKYTTKVSEDVAVTHWILFFPALPFSLIGSFNAFERLSEHAYQDFDEQGAF